MRCFVLLALFLVAAAPTLPAQTDDALPALVEVLGQTDDPQFQFDVLKGMSEGLRGRRGVKMPAGWEEVSAKLSKSPNLQVRELAQSLSLTFGSPTALASLRQIMQDSKADTEVRKRAIESLLQTKDPALATVLQQLLQDPAVRSPALRGLANYDEPKIPATIVGVYSSLSAAEK